MSSGKLRSRKARQDPFWKRAKAEQYAARSAFKLEEIDQRYGLIRPGTRLLDLGCRPGSWLQYAQKRVGSTGVLVGLDRAPLDVKIPRARIIVADVLKVSAQTLRGDLLAFDVVLSDMAPDTSGFRSIDQARSEVLFERALDLGIELLAAGGAFVGKLFQGPDFARLRAKAQSAFEKVKLEKPASSRKESSELYVVGLGKKTTSV